MKKSMMYNVAIIAVALATLSGCATMAPADTSSDEAAIRAVFDTYVSTLVKYDADGWMALWDEAGVQMPPDSPMFVGKAEIKKANYDAIKDPSFVFTMTITTQEVKVFTAEGYGYARGVYDWTLTPKAGGPAMTYDGKFSTLLHKQADGTWLLYRDCFNSNKPAQ